MKKSMLYTGIAYVLAGLACFALAISFEWEIEPLLWGFGGAGTFPGLMMLWKYFHWAKPENQEEYARRLHTERIEMKDERKIMLRDKSGRLANQIMLAFYCLMMLLFGVCGCLGWFMPFARYAILGLCALLILQYFCWCAAFRYLSKRL